jgi:hypothetical protein
MEKQEEPTYIDSRATAQNEAYIGFRKSKRRFLDITSLVRSVQRAEGNPDCFRRSKGSCDRMDCKWRKYCLEHQKNENDAPYE